MQKKNNSFDKREHNRDPELKYVLFDWWTANHIVSKKLNQASKQVPIFSCDWYQVEELGSRIIINRKAAFLRQLTKA